MRSKTILGITMLVAVLALCSFAPQAKAQNEGDWTPTYVAQWWWKYVRTATSLDVVAVNVAEVKSDRAGYVAHQVVFTMLNNSRIDYKGGDMFSVGHMYTTNDIDPKVGPATWRPTDLSRGFLPAVQAGQMIRIGHIAYTPEKGNFLNFFKLSVGP